MCEAGHRCPYLYTEARMCMYACAGTNKKMILFVLFGCFLLPVTNFLVGFSDTKKVLYYNPKGATLLQQGT